LPTAHGQPNANCASNGPQSEAKKRGPVRVRASIQPTFVRFVFEMPEGVSVSSVLNEQKLQLLFNSALVFDLADAKLAAPSNIASINQKVEGESSVVEITMVGDVDVHSFREEKNYVIDVAFQQGEKPSSVLPSLSDASHAPTPAAPAVTVPAMPEKAAAEKAPAMAAPPRQAAEVVPPTPEVLAQKADTAVSPEQARRPRPKSKCPRSRQTSRRLSHARPRQKCSSLRPCHRRT